MKKGVLERIHTHTVPAGIAIRTLSSRFGLLDGLPLGSVEATCHSGGEVVGHLHLQLVFDLHLVPHTYTHTYNTYIYPYIVED